MYTDENEENSGGATESLDKHSLSSVRIGRGGATTLPVSTLQSAVWYGQDLEEASRSRLIYVPGRDQESHEKAAISDHIPDEIQTKSFPNSSLQTH
jgi:hypothetical protein